MGEFDQVNKSKKKFLLFCSVLTLPVVVSGVILWCCGASEHHEKAVYMLRNSLKNMSSEVHMIEQLLKEETM